MGVLLVVSIVIVIGEGVGDRRVRRGRGMLVFIRFRGGDGGCGVMCDVNVRSEAGKEIGVLGLVCCM